MYNITFQQIEAFLTVAKSLNLSKAGEILYTSQPALSKTLKRFEDGVGMKLFIRSNQGMILTSDGEYLYSVLEPIYKSMVQCIRIAQHNASMPLKYLRIVYTSTYFYSKDFDPVRETVEKYKKRYPDVKMHEVLHDIKELRQALEFGNADIVVTEDFCVRDMPDISIKRINPMKTFIALSAKHPVAQCQPLELSMLDGLTCFAVPTMNDEQSDIEAIRSWCRKCGFMPQVELMPNFLSLLHAIYLGKGFAITSTFEPFNAADSIVFIPFPLSASPYVCVAWRTGKISREVKNFVDMLPDSEEEDTPVNS
ncbi:MAG: LysR family transcriptional regulator [Clostridiales bacterium]|nr:LysR family transcriptional regulator [Clostridiales bacterium]